MAGSSVTRINGKSWPSSYFSTMLYRGLLIFALMMGMASSSHSAGSPAVPKSILGSLAISDTTGSALDTAAIRALYMDGEFDEAVRKLETARKNGGLKSHADSIFAYKHLGVMYAARYETMEVGKRYMYQLLSIEPAVRIMDMHASDMIYMIFRNVQAEHEIRLARPRNRDTLSKSPKPTLPRPASTESKKRTTWPYWTAAAVTAVGLGITTFILLDGASSADKYEGGL